MKEIYYKIIDLPSHQVLVVRDFDEEKEGNNSLIVIEFFNEGMKLRMSLGYDSEEKRDAMFEKVDKEIIKGMLEKAVPGINLLEMEAEEATNGLNQNQKDAVNEIISNVVLLEDPIKPTDKFNDDLGCDSLDTIELIMEVEEEFGITILDEDAEQIVTVQDAYDLLAKLL